MGVRIVRKGGLEVVSAKTLGKRLRQLAELEGVDAAEIARAVGVKSAQTIRNFEEGRSSPDWRIVYGYLNYLEVPHTVVEMTDEEFAEFFRQRGQRRVERLLVGEQSRNGSRRPGRRREAQDTKGQDPTGESDDDPTMIQWRESLRSAA